MKEADVKLSWKRSASADVVKHSLTVNIDGNSQSLELGADVEEYLLTLRALSSVTVTSIVTDSEGNTSPEVSYSFQIGDLEAPQSVSDFRHDVVAIRDVVEPPVEPPTE